MRFRSKLAKRLVSLEYFLGASYDSQEEDHNERDYGTMRGFKERLDRLEKEVFPKNKKRP